MSKRAIVNCLPGMESFLLTSSQEDSRARTFHRRAKARASKGRARASGLNSVASLTKYDLLGCSLKMFLLCECEALTSCSLAWKNSGTPAGRSWWALTTLERPTEGSGFGSWHTPKKTDGDKWSGCRIPGDPMSAGLTEQAKASWPTPQAHDSREQGKSRPIVNGRIQTHAGGSVSVNLPLEVKQWPSPQANDDKGLGHATPSHSPQLRHLPELLAGQAVQDNHNTTGKPQGSLSAMWVMQLQGWPDGWMDFF
jgi:hypothetical protein